MKVHGRIVLLISALAGFAMFAFLSSARQLPNAVALPSTSDDLPLYLNGERVGSMSNTQALESRLRALKDKVPPNFNAEYGPSVGRMVLVPDKQVAIIQLGQVLGKLDDFFGYQPDRFAFWTGPSCDETHARKSGGQVFVLSNAPLSNAEVDKIKASEQCWLNTGITTIAPSRYSTRTLKSYRTGVSSIEILPGGAYALNEQVKDARLRVSPNANVENTAFRRKIDAAPITRRPLDAAALTKEIAAWIDRRGAEDPRDEFSDAVSLPVIVQPTASYDTLSPILRTVGSRKVKLTVIVDNTGPRPPANVK